ncbi:MAG: TIGR02757 family protein [Candidatus Mcinerneyibacterium aminivorans]|uniref:TIGR02757 family protein n=1 Tax=Candidatus Mcinerneyibacterium aminivorans TaxID=2703815 RepID=A0A5D0MAL0_9BACT|nr:MAG: TIGR02757 family protein [Candidatus Mcinerneyibacterium aminivorans]
MINLTPYFKFKKKTFMELKNFLENIYKKYNRKKYIDPDPLMFLYDYPDSKDREIVALIASSFAYGRVNKIIETVHFILKGMNYNPYEFIKNSSRKSLEDKFENFVYRFTNQNELVEFILAIKDKIDKFNTIKEFFKKQFIMNDKKVLPSLECFVTELGYHSRGVKSLLSLPSKKSACKRLFLFLRWMVRKDRVDPGGWNFVDRSKLIIPLDTHMYRISKLLGFTERKQANLKTAVQITDKFKRINEKDPVKYDFALTRYGIRDELEIAQLEFH